MKITRELIFSNRTDNGAWTREQLKALGVSWPPKRGWMNKIIGDEISAENCDIFKRKRTAKQCKP